MNTPGNILIVDDDLSLIESLTGLLEHAGHAVRYACNGKDALAAVGSHPTDLVLLDLRLGSEHGLDLLPRLKTLRPEMSVIMITALGTVENAVEAMRLGADNFITKPLDPPQLLAILAKGFEARELRHRSSRLERLSGDGAREIVTVSPAMEQALNMIDTVADRDTTVLLLGETGTGKGMMARRIHHTSRRSEQPFVELNCAGLQPELTESELFGHERGAFTGAAERKLGLFEAAHHGTLFLDEIGEMDPAVQAKLLHVLEEQHFRRLGGVTEIEADVRVLVATHRNLEALAAEGTFRQDLFYRLNVFAVPIPPLRERPEDILPLAIRFLAEYRGGDGSSAGLSDDAAAILQSYRWPGNVRELRNVMERAAILCPADAAIQPSHLPPLPAGGSPQQQPQPSSAVTMDDAEQRALEQALQAHDGNIQAAARQLGVSRGTLYRKIRKYGL
ncbi:MAG: sigma-54-dependent Fis family transcriptional regulator [Acidobacteria bacterium]|uniref:Sigma-54-dependent Fis family transcriptional regulator n=1 Tax=Candidatus Polarisedimenticola svalbardensis TaxID=2886004 RepID=A0A8J6Y014_9BACT|nr:sigma-54-dependent Fis family transcriptional regulator [Candidatus Polarisedimenticola svalbardensis]